MARDFIYIDSDKVKEILKDALDMGEGDMSGNKLGLSSKIVPTVCLNPVPRWQNDVVYVNDGPVQNTWYQVFDDWNVRIKSIGLLVDGFDETIELEILADDKSAFNVGVAATAGTTYTMVNYEALLDQFTFGALGSDSNKSFEFEAQHLKLRVRKTTAGGASHINLRIKWFKWG